MRQVFALLCACLLLAGCGGAAERAEETPLTTPRAAAEAAAAGQAGLPELHLLEGAEADAYLAAYYALDPEAGAEAAVLLAGGVEAAELAVLLLPDAAAAQEAEAALEAYRVSRAADFTGYAPAQEAMALSGRAVRTGRWAALLICPDPDLAENDLRRALSGSPPAPAAAVPPSPAVTPSPAPSPTPSPTPEPTPEQDDPYSTGPEYDAAAVLEAWRSGDGSGLSEKNRAVLEASRSLLERAVQEDMSDYEKELAVHDWLISHAEYDPGALDHLFLDVEPEPDHNNPYGLLLRGKGICVGYSSSFQLLMDMLGIECRTVYGTANEGGPGHEHAWNLVKLDGEWYCVDVTWDDPVGLPYVSEATAHKYFNVTSDFLRANRHYWDEEDVPEAQATVWSWN